MEKWSLATGNLPGVIYSHLESQLIVGEQFIEEHGICYMISGNLKVRDAGENKIFSAGDIIFFRKNFLAKFIKEPAEKGAFKAITVMLDRKTLLEFSRQYDVAYEQPYLIDGAVLQLDNNILLENFYRTLIPYFDSALPDRLMNLKKYEILMLLLQVSPVLKNVLFDFNQPGKIDLEAFMQQNFRFNVELKKLAFLTGRSLTTFKRDFDKIFHTTPNRWIQRRRLEEALYLIRDKGRRPSDVYHEVGFESISHFSYSFKQLFGYNPSGIGK